MKQAMITRAQCRAEGACYEDAELEAFIPSEGISPSDLVSLIGETRAGRTLTASDCHWALCNGVPEPERFAREYRLHAVWCARRELARIESPDQRSVAAVDVAERFATGMATEAELDAARDAAWSALRAAARVAARAADSAANSAAYSVASWDAARAAAWEAERLEQCQGLAARLELA